MIAKDQATQLKDVSKNTHQGLCRQVGKESEYPDLLLGRGGVDGAQLFALLRRSLRKQSVVS